MILCFDVGNTDVHGGVYREGKLVTEFRKAVHLRPTADEFGVFVLQLLQIRGIEASDLQAIAVASVVPDCNAMMMEACRHYLGCKPLLLQAGVRTGLKIRVRNPGEVGADRIANAIAAVDMYPEEDRIVIDTGTATTFCAINRQNEYLGGAITAGLMLSMRALATNTAKLTSVDLVERPEALGRSTVESLQSGLYFGHLGLMRELIGRLTDGAFSGRKPVVLITGGHAHLFEKESIVDKHVPDLVLRGLCRAVELNEDR